MYDEMVISKIDTIVLFFLEKNTQMIPKTTYEIISDEIDHEGEFIPLVFPKIGVELVSKMESTNGFICKSKENSKDSKYCGNNFNKNNLVTSI